jgi:hypothetical protein
MLTLMELGELARSLRDERLLSVYVDGRVSDPAARNAWRTRLDGELRALRRSLDDAPRADREAFDRAATHLLDQLALDGGPAGPAWVAFAGGDGVRYAGSLPTSVPARVEWTTGPCIAPYLCALKQQRPVLAAVVNSRRTSLHRYQEGTVEALGTIEAEWHGGPPSHMGDAPRLGFHPGTRGAAGTDEAERRRLAAIATMAATTAKRLAALAGRDAWIVLGGTPEPLGALQKALPASLVDRTLVVPSLHDGASEAMVRRAAEEGASLLRTLHDLVDVDELFERYGAAGLAVVGPEATRRALDDGSVQSLVLTQGFLTTHADVAEATVRAALEQRAEVADVGGAAGERLDRHGGGIGARLRFTRSQRAAAP